MANMFQKIKLFCFNLKKIYHFGGPKHSPNTALPGLGIKKKSSTILYLIAVLLNLKFQLDKLKNNEEKAIIVFFCSFANN
jgi:hypothetical protein